MAVNYKFWSGGRGGDTMRVDTIWWREGVQIIVLTLLARGMKLIIV
jgi:hypothetical protein